MKKGLIIVILVVAGLIAAAGLVIGAVLEFFEAIIGFVVWAIIILAGYLIIKIKT